LHRLGRQGRTATILTGHARPLADGLKFSALTYDAFSIMIDFAS
jgi:hypothetical protein